MQNLLCGKICAGRRPVTHQTDFVWHVHVLPMFTESEQEELMNAVATQYSLSATAGEVFVLHINKVLTIIFWYVI
jgi:hypothetical protein